jgi:hypothetical protein
LNKQEYFSEILKKQIIGAINECRDSENDKKFIVLNDIDKRLGKIYSRYIDNVDRRTETVLV